MIDKQEEFFDDKIPVHKILNYDFAVCLRKWQQGTTFKEKVTCLDCRRMEPSTIGWLLAVRP